MLVAMLFVLTTLSLAHVVRIEAQSPIAKALQVEELSGQGGRPEIAGTGAALLTLPSSG